MTSCRRSSSPGNGIPQKDRLRIQRRLSDWFRKYQRPLPWRRNRDAYAVWISEIMLQQTQVAMVIPYFERFLKSFPTLKHLASATEQAVLRHWEGLGYYRRARDLHRSARTLVRQHRGRFPRDPAVLKQLPGFGRYTVGAVLSQAFDCRFPILEANSRRVLCRLFGVRGNPRSAAIDKRLWKLAESLLPRDKVGEFNQALMELGALVCTAKAPRCEQCPLIGSCEARRLNLQHKIPARQSPVKAESLAEIAVVVRRGRRVLLVQRPRQGRWGGLWEFPHAPSHPDESSSDAARRLVAQLTGIACKPGREIMSVRHGIMRYRITLTCFEAAHAGGRFRSQAYSRARWVAPEQLNEFPVSSPQRQLARALSGLR